ncbi:hypothetical protein DFH07DRAFT_967744 [Mycena maculata]|uniref:Uncharacterized protein n=1 Tax=Mycena maculata TaxID=230809 RepID=A0AAD7I4D0_9AGAR|nr:hypothetical protein DFH07DRAFT_967744 [Mycena maculata]
MDFPPELEREIFETTADLNPEIMPSLFLVSRHIHEWRMKLRRLSLDLMEVFAGMGSIDFSLQLFSSITHLEIFESSDREHFYEQLPDFS